MTLNQWLELPEANHYRPIHSHVRGVGIHDVQAIEPVRSDLWGLDDYRVSAVSGGAIWLESKACLSGETTNA